MSDSIITPKIKNSKLLYIYLRLQPAIFQFFPNGGPNKWSSTPLANAKTMFRELVEMIDHAFIVENYEWHVAVETNETKSSVGPVTGLIIFDGVRTSAVPVKLSVNVFRIAKEPIFILQKRGAFDVFDCIFHQIDRAIEAVVA